MAAKLNGKDIAKLAGVSVSAVSIVLNGKPGVSDKTREKISKILEENNIKPRTGSRKNYAERKDILFCKIARNGNILNERHNVFISEYADGIVEESNRQGFNIEVLRFDKDKSIDEIIDSIRKRTWVSGCIVLATEFTSSDVDAFNNLGIPVVFVDSMFFRLSGMFVNMDNTGMTYTALKYLKDMGHTRIGILQNSSSRNFFERSRAFRISAGELGLQYNPDWVLDVRTTHAEACRDISRLITAMDSKNMPTAFLAVSDVIAIAALQTFEELGIKVPQQISVIGFDNLPVSSVVQPALTTMDVPKLPIGRFSVRLLKDSMDQSRVLPNRCVFNGKLVERSSVAKI